MLFLKCEEKILLFLGRAEADYVITISLFNYARVSSGSIAGKSATLSFDFFGCFPKIDMSKNALGKKFPMGRHSCDGCARERESAADLFGWVCEKILIFYRRGLLIRCSSRKEKRPRGSRVCISAKGRSCERCGQPTTKLVAIKKGHNIFI